MTCVIISNCISMHYSYSLYI